VWKLDATVSHPSLIAPGRLPSCRLIHPGGVRAAHRFGPQHDKFRQLIRVKLRQAPFQLDDTRCGCLDDELALPLALKASLPTVGRCHGPADVDACCQPFLDEPRGEFSCAILRNRRQKDSHVAHDHPLYFVHRCCSVRLT